VVNNLFKWKIREKVASYEILVTALMIIPPIFLFFISFLVGRYPVSLNDVVMASASKIFFINSSLLATVNTIIFDIRLPRILAAMMISASLSIAGAAFQGLFQNLLVSPDKHGVSDVAGFGAALAILFSASMFMIQFSAFFGGLIAVGLTYFLGRAFKGTSMLTLVLCGIAIASLFAALLSLIKYVADPYGQLPTIVFWLMGSLAAVNNPDMIIMGIPIFIGTVILLMVRWRLNVLSMGE